MGKKKVKPSAFSVFMHEFLAEERRSGRTYPKEEWSTVTKPHFERLTAAEKERYKLLAKRMPARTVMQPPKYTSQGVPLEQVEREQRELAEKKRFMERKVKHIVKNAFLENDIKSRPFVFIMANYFYKTNSGMYSPAEIAIAKFSFEDAILKFYHTFVNPETVTIGYAFEAKDRSEKVHRLPPPPNALGEKDYEKIYSAILGVLDSEPGQTFDKSDSRRPYVFTRKEDNEVIESILDQLSEVAEKQWHTTFDVFDFELLFNELKNNVELATEPIRITVTNTFIEQDRYDSTPNISCDFHENEDVTRHCALSYVRRWFFLCADHICEKIGVKLVPGKHLPANARLEAPIPFEDYPFIQSGKKRSDDQYSSVSSSYTGYSKFSDSDDSSSDD
ncbi:protein maelstrom homolog isoform X1 [Sitodiplosis mosellana]|uniref:protein maelstrom homolog isoform X1 n=1 Tax=Sitodiplosis mosellana TaxID=263140 RepID=UPI002444A3AA|nr:protein maelstrom homolog isoform X1 [Sitodiplosis mosellana]